MDAWNSSGTHGGRAREAGSCGYLPLLLLAEPRGGSGATLRQHMNSAAKPRMKRWHGPLLALSATLRLGIAAAAGRRWGKQHFRRP